ncbi:flagellar basal body protein FliL [Amycolatopsis antarctica]|uniref:Flagellar basal body protein FliL n=1 Tax=Amycolatopsis antarctica TaxID=1854586 RepID=A0A263D4H6_9PSEU|nr:flagellar basal body protein FliL [Amycolatopsis antarctica]
MYAQQVGGEPPRKGRRGLVVGLVIALVALVGGGVTWFAVAQGDSVAAGSANPTEAATNLVNSLGNGDVVGLLSTLAPAEASLFTDPIEEATTELKRLQVLDGNADPAALSGVELKTENLVFDDAAAEKVNDHLTITKLTGGTLTVTADLSKIPLAKDFIDAALSDRDRRELEQGPQTQTIDIGKEVREEGQPVRIATVNVDGEWYPSMLYSIADYALLEEGKPWPQQSIAANGAGSSEDAVKQMLQAALDADVSRVIELLPPDEMAVMHDVGPAIVEAVGREEPSGATVDTLTTETAPITGGTRATVTAVEMTGPNGEKASITKSGDCYEMASEGRTERLCASELAEMAEQEASDKLPPEVRDVLVDLGAGVMEQGLGVVTTEVEGKHYVSPIRTFTEAGMTVLRSLQPEDVKALIRAAN